MERSDGVVSAKATSKFLSTNFARFSGPRSSFLKAKISVAFVGSCWKKSCFMIDGSSWFSISNRCIRRYSWVGFRSSDFVFRELLLERRVKVFSRWVDWRIVDRTGYQRPMNILSSGCNGTGYGLGFDCSSDDCWSASCWSGSFSGIVAVKYNFLSWWTI